MGDPKSFKWQEFGIIVVCTLGWTHFIPLLIHLPE